MSDGGDFQFHESPEVLPDFIFLDIQDYDPQFGGQQDRREIERLETELVTQKIRIEQLEQAVRALGRQRQSSGVPIVGETPKEEADRIVADWIRRQKR